MAMERSSEKHHRYDQDHAMQLRLIDSALASCDSDVPRSLKYLTQLAKLARPHFDSEEELMRFSGYAGADLHVREHEKLFNSISSLIANTLEFSSGDFREELNRLKTGFSRHMDFSDLDFDAHYRRWAEKSVGPG